MSPHPLLLDGESLRWKLDLEPWQGNREKYEPRTAEEARRLLLPQIETSCIEAASIPERLRGERVVVETTFLPNYLAPSYQPSGLLAFLDAMSVGSRYAEGLLETRTQTRQSPTRRLILAVTDDGLERLQTLVTNRGGATRSERRAFEDIRTLNDFGLPKPDSILLTTDFGDGESVTVECVLHPTGINAMGDPTPAGDDIIEKWGALVEALGGTPYFDFVRTTSGLTFAPALVNPTRARELARFNPLRAVRPMPTPTWR